MQYPGLMLQLPDWVEKFTCRSGPVFATMEERMRFVIELSRLNIEHNTGGPFGAAVFAGGAGQSGKLIAPGVNIVVPARCSIAHAEIVAVAIAQQILGCNDLSSKGASFELVTSAEPCAMCLGAIPWSGITKVICGALDADARDIGFDEGAKPTDWIQSFKNRGITVLQSVLRDEAKSVLLQYQKSNGIIYNPHRENS
jgi:tRNA(Arg) A34 adenosine deaminase TadA